MGEVTITLQDIEILVGLPTLGLPVSTTDRSRSPQSWCDVVARILGRRPASGVDVVKSTLIQSWLIQTFADGPALDGLTPAQAQREIDYHIRAHIFMLLGILFCDTSQSRLRLHFLLLLEDLRQVGAYSWGSACLAYTYRQLCNGALCTTKDIGGAMLIVQLWAWERLPTFAPGTLPFDMEDSPRGARWVREIDVTRVSTHVLRVYRDELEMLPADRFVWQPYHGHEDEIPDYCLEGRDLWCVRCPLICFEVVEWHYPDRVLRQFGLRQCIPQAPEGSQTSLHQLTRSGTARDWQSYHAHYIDLWVHRVPFLPDDDDTLLDTYMHWYRRITRRHLLNPAHTPPPDGFMGAYGQRDYLAEQLSHVFHTVHIDTGSIDSHAAAVLSRVESISREALLHVGAADLLTTPPPTSTSRQLPVPHVRGRRRRRGLDEGTSGTHAVDDDAHIQDQIFRQSSHSAASHDMPVDTSQVYRAAMPDFGSTQDYRSYIPDLDFFNLSPTQPPVPGFPYGMPSAQTSTHSLPWEASHHSPQTPWATVSAFGSGFRGDTSGSGNIGQTSQSQQLTAPQAEVQTEPTLEGTTQQIQGQRPVRQARLRERICFTGSHLI